MSEPQKDAYGVYRDGYGRTFQTPDGQPPVAGTPIQVLDGNGNKTNGTWMGYAAENKTSS